MMYYISIIACLFFMSHITTLESEKINDCNRCKVLSDSFKNWLQKTTRGKHDGGDAAWEETKLKSYLRSEMRLVEIQEGLCSDVKMHQAQCYSLAEETEHLIEQWWVHEDSNSQDLFLWLCVDTLQYCCPKNRYGKLCTLCPIDKNNKICGERGVCDGEGTREGNGTCNCNTGFSGKLCESCAENFFSLSADDCIPCHKACDGCTGKGAAACKLCKTGWQLESGVCVDINECTESNLCESHQYCVNFEGSYTCRNCDHSCETCIGEGQANCTSCKHNHILWGGMCLDKISRQQFLTNAVERVVLYLFSFIIAILIYKRMKTMASIIVLLLGIIMYVQEKNAKVNIFFLLEN